MKYCLVSRSQTLGKMQLLLGLRDAWKCIEVRLEDGCTPCIGGKAVCDCNIEPAQWFKVRVNHSNGFHWANEDDDCTMDNIIRGTMLFTIAVIGHLLKRSPQATRPDL